MSSLVLAAQSARIDNFNDNDENVNDNATSCIGGTVGDPLEGVEETSKHEAGGLHMVIIIIL